MSRPCRQMRSATRYARAWIGALGAACGLVGRAPAVEAPRGPTGGAWDQAVIDAVFAPSPGHEDLHGRVSWGVTRTGGGPDGVVLLELEPAIQGGPLARAGCFPGDVVLAVNGRPLRSSAEFDTAVRGSRPFTPVNLLVSQAGKRSLRTVVPTGVLRVAVRDLQPRVTVPGVPPAAAEPAATGDAAINVLEAVAIDRESGTVVVSGRFDPTYRTGPIGYLDLLATAASSPAPPRLSLQPEIEWSETRPATKADGTIRVLMALPAAEVERQELVRLLPPAFGISAEDYVLLHDYAWFERAKRLPPPPEVARSMRQFLRHLGWEDVATAYEGLCTNTAEGFAAALGALGREEDARGVRDASGQDASRVFNALANRACIAIMERLGLPPVQARNLEALTDSGAEEVRPMLDKLYRDLPCSARDVRGRFPMETVLAAINIGDAATRVLADFRAPIPVRIETFDVERTSLLARIMYAADYVGKLATVRSDLFRSIPGHETIYQYTGRRLGALPAAQRTLAISGLRDAAYWFAPTRVELRSAPDRSLVTFGESLVEMRTVPLGEADKAGSRPAADAALVREFNQGWCDQFTKHYDRYAAVLPELHALREAAKMVALARWAREQGVRLNLEGVRQERWDPPDLISGFARSGTICFTAAVDGPYEDVTLLGAAGQTGGVSFADPADWIVAERAADAERVPAERSTPRP